MYALIVFGKDFEGMKESDIVWGCTHLGGGWLVTPVRRIRFPSAPLPALLGESGIFDQRTSEKAGFWGM